jgi:hypothetical protein
MAKQLEDIRIMVFSVPSWNSKVGANSWATFLSKYDPKHIACVCLRDETPDSTVCGRYFIISENRVISSALGKKIDTGYEVPAKTNSNMDSTNTDLHEHITRYQKYQKKRRYLMLLARELVWKLGKWKTKEFDAFLDSFHPNLILHSMDGYIHMNDIVAYALKKTGAKSIGYIWDDNFTYKLSKSIGFCFYRYLQRRSLKELAKITDSFFSISDITKQEADAFFRINSTIITKPLNSTPVFFDNEYTVPFKIVYTGSLIIGRNSSLKKVIKQIDAINACGIVFVLDVYTNTMISEEERRLLSRPYCVIHEAITQEEVFKKQREADILLFLEAIDGKYSNNSRLSFSTKITDYLSAGRTILAIGKRNEMPLMYFAKTDSALVCSDDEQIRETLELIASNPNVLNVYAQKCCVTGTENFNPIKIQGCFDQLVLETMNK